MMNLNIVFAVSAVLVIGFCDNVHSDKDIAELKESCKAQEKATDADMKVWESEPIPKPRIVKCLEACVLEKLGLISKNKINVDAVIELYTEESKDEKEKANMKEILNECKGVTDNDRCEASAKVQQCLNDGCRKRGMKEIF